MAEDGSTDNPAKDISTGNSAEKPLVLVDGSSYLFRAYHALPDLRTSSNFPTGAVRGVISMIRKLAKTRPAEDSGWISPKPTVETVMIVM